MIFLWFALGDCFCNKFAYKKLLWQLFGIRLFNRLVHILINLEWYVYLCCVVLQIWWLPHAAGQITARERPVVSVGPSGSEKELGRTCKKLSLLCFPHLKIVLWINCSVYFKLFSYIMFMFIFQMHWNFDMYIRNRVDTSPSPVDWRTMCKHLFGFLGFMMLMFGLGEVFPSYQPVVSAARIFGC